MPASLQRTASCLHEYYIVERLLPVFGLPNYAYTLDHISNICAHCLRLFETIGVRESEVLLQLRQRSSGKIHIYTVCKPGKEEKIFEGIFQSHDVSKSTSTMVELPKIARSLGDFDPVVFLAKRESYFRRMGVLGIDRHDPRLHFVEVGNETHRSYRTRPAQKVTNTIEKKTLQTIDQLLVTYISTVLSGEVDALQYLLNMCDHSGKDMTFDERMFKDFKKHGLIVEQQKRLAELKQCQLEIEDILQMIGQLCSHDNLIMTKTMPTTNHVDFQTLQKVLERDKNAIIRCGERFGNLHIFISADAGKDKPEIIKRKIRDFAKNIQYQIHFIHRQAIPFGLYIGSRVGDETVFGTLGGFACKTEKQNDEKRTCALISRHVASTLRNNPCPNFFGPGISGTILLPFPPNVDIAAVCMEPSIIKTIDFSYKDVYERTVTRHMFTFDKAEFQKQIVDFRLVFLRGAVTKLGYGEILSANTEYAGQNVASLHILDRIDKPDFPLAQPGDSGSMVCALNKNGDVFALAILVGQVAFTENEARRVYLAYMLQEGLEEMSQVHNAKYEFLR